MASFKLCEMDSRSYAALTHGVEQQQGKSQ
jgi:hypothetical protein